MLNSFGNLFKVTTFGESHGPGIGAVVDGCPPLLPISEAEIQQELNRRRPGKDDRIASPRKELDLVQILSGVHQGRTLGSPIALWIQNTDARSADYQHLSTVFRPSHADFTYQKKYGIRDPQGGGRASARETIARVAAGAIAKKILTHANNIEILAFIERIGGIGLEIIPENLSPELLEASPVRCPNPSLSEQMIQRIITAKEAGDSVGGVIHCIIRNVPVGLGAPVFSKLEADLAKAMLSIPATKGFEIGSGFSGAEMTGSQHNDAFEATNGHVSTTTNFSGGIQGGISNGQPIYFRIAFKPTSTISIPQKTVDTHHNPVDLPSATANGRHDPCVLPRAVPIVEAMAALVLVDHYLLHVAQNHVFSFE